MIIPQIDYQWFYSALSQSLAALIGIVGMFIVYRLQIQENNINNAIRNLQNSFSIGKPDFYSHFTREETVKEAEYRIKQIQSNIEIQKGLFRELEEQLRKKQVTEEGFIMREKNYQVAIKSHNENILRFQTRIDKIVEKEHWRNNIKWSAFLAILYLIVLFCFSLIGLIYSNYFFKNPLLGNMYTIAVFCLLLGGLCNLVICCAVSLDIGQPKIK